MIVLCVHNIKAYVAHQKNCGCLDNLDVLLRVK